MLRLLLLLVVVLLLLRSRQDSSSTQTLPQVATHSFLPVQQRRC